MYSDTLFVCEYLKSKLEHCCYLTVTVQLLLLVIYWWSLEQASYFTVGTQVGGAHLSRARLFLKFFWNISFALRHTKMLFCKIL